MASTRTHSRIHSHAHPIRGKWQRPDAASDLVPSLSCVARRRLPLFFLWRTKVICISLSGTKRRFGRASIGPPVHAADGLGNAAWAADWEKATMNGSLEQLLVRVSGAKAGI